MSGLRLLGTANDVDTLRVRAVAKCLSIELPVEHEDTSSAAFLKNCHPLGKEPVLETPHGYIFEAGAVARYLAEEHGDGTLRGISMFQRSEVDMWMDFCSTELENPVKAWVGPLLGWMKTKDLVGDAAKYAGSALTALEEWLVTRTFLVGDRLTIADIWIAVALVPVFQNVLDPAMRKHFTHLSRWFDTVINQPGVRDVVKPQGFCSKTPEGFAVVLPVKEKSQPPKQEGKKEKQEGKKEKQEGKKEKQEGKKEQQEGKKDKQERKKEKQEGKKEKQEGKKQEKAKGGKGGSKIPDDGSALDLRVGYIVSAEKHPEADGLYVEKIDVGEAAPRQICSGLVKHLPIEKVRERKVLVWCNLKPRPLRGVESNGMVLCSENADGSNVDLVTVPEDAVAGDRLILEGYEEPTGATKEVLPSKKVTELIGGLHSDENGVVMWKDASFVIPGKGKCIATHKSSVVR